MFSNQYHYFQIRADAQFSKITRSDELSIFVTEYLKMVPAGPGCFVGSCQQPWINLSVYKASSDGNYAGQQICPEYVNLVGAVVSKGAADYKFYVTYCLK